MIKVVFCLALLASIAAKHEERCSTLSCIHASALIIQKMNTDVEPCDDFYEFACGLFAEDHHTPDEKTTVDLFALMGDKLIEYLLTQMAKDFPANAPKNHLLTKSFYTACMDFEKVNERGKQPLLDVLNSVGGWPMLSGSAWNASGFDWKESILNLRRYITKKDNDIFNKAKDPRETNEVSKKWAEDEDFARLEKGLKVLIKSVVTTLNGKETDLDKHVDELIDFEKSLDEYFRKLAAFQRVYAQELKEKKIAKIKKVKDIHKYVLWMNLFSPSFLANSSKIIEEIPRDLNQQYLDFIEATPPRVIANFICWRIVQASLAFLDRDIRNAVLAFEKEAFGKEDYEQRWILCATSVTVYAPVAVGDLYISYYFSEDDKNDATQMVDFILEEYKDTIRNADWMDDDTKERALNVTEKIEKYIGYHDRLRNPDGETYYNDLFVHSNDKFLEMGLSLLIHNADREFRLLNLKKVQSDWTKYSKPATINAFYNSKDNSIQFPAAILQSPNFDKDRPPFLNFGAIGSIIGHEITHAFDDQASKFESWSEKSRNAYKKRVNCIIDQYTNYRVKEIEEFELEQFGNDAPFHLNGNFTQKEDIADCGGIKLALNAYKRYEKKFPNAKIRPIGLDDYDKQQLFWISFAQTYCSVERPERMKNKIETDEHSLDRFRVIGPLSNLPEFAASFKCPVGSNMNPNREKCAVW